jgi:hypothetical protein
MDCVLPKCIRWAPDCVQAVREAQRQERERREVREGDGADGAGGRPTKLERLAGEIKRVNGVADRR